MKTRGSGDGLKRSSSGEDLTSMKVNSGPTLGMSSNPYFNEANRIMSAPQMANQVSAAGGSAVF